MCITNRWERSLAVDSSVSDYYAGTAFPCRGDDHELSDQFDDAHHHAEWNPENAATSHAYAAALQHRGVDTSVYSKTGATGAADAERS